ncbi:hypothetical protein RRG08_051329 [Elysia crispata]|uniref:C2H2-type domain-containing protein n=1 Tax=Elysia crispata TaxID=231223 RepID=A0AAE1B532_9GAST|nr:hypothetical protein RRG08_051329 [Elysia crispata]
MTSGYRAERMWQPGNGCPVHGCRLRVARDVFDLRRHWKEKHEEIIAMFHCSACPYVAKRKYRVFQHYRLRHNSNVINGSPECIGRIEYQHNKEFIDPQPLTLEAVLR